MTFEKGFGIMLFSRARRREERGAILVLSTVGLVLAMIAAGLAIDLGRIAQAARDDQRIADMAALDASRVAPADYPVAAAASAARNGLPADATVNAIEGIKTNGQCVAAPGSGTVCVTVTSPHKNAFPFLAGRDSVTRTAMAGAGNAIGRVRVGSSLASASGTIPPMEVLMLNKVFTSLLGGNYSLNAVGWQGVAASKVEYGLLTSELANVTGNGTFNTGTPDEVLNSTFTAKQLLTATANVLNRNGTTAAGTNVLGMANAVNANGTYLSQPLKLYDFFDFGSVVVGNKQDVANAQLDVFELVKGATILADGNHFASFDLSAADVIGPAIPGGFTNAKISMGLIEAPQTSFPGPPGKDATNTYYTKAHTSQIRVRLDVSIRFALTNALTTTLLDPITNLPIVNTLLPAGSLVNATVSYYLNAGNAHAYLEAIRCGSTAVPTEVDILGVTDVGTSKLGFVNDTNLGNQLANPIPGTQTVISGLAGVVNVKTTSVTGSDIPGNPGVIRTFTPPYDGTTSQQVPGTMLSLPSLATTNLTVDPLVLGLDTGSLFTDLVSGINSTGLTFNQNAPGVTTSILKPLYDVLGLSFGTADLWAPPVQTCAAISPVPTQLTAVPVLRG